MKRFSLALMLLGLTFLAAAQEKPRGDFQIGLQGGASFPLDTYKKIGETKTGFFGGLFLDKYFKGNKFGLGIDARFIQNGINKADSFMFANGNIGTNYKNETRFQDYLFTFGPSYKFTKNSFHAEIYVRGGLMMQNFPEYTTTLTYSNPLSTANYDIKYTVNDASNKANSWAGLGGLRLNYNLSPKIALFAHVDYVQTFGTRFGSKPSRFTIEKSVEHTPIDPKVGIKGGYLDHYNEVRIQENTLHKSLNAGAGIKFIFGKSKKATEPIKNEPIVETIKPQINKKDLQVVVKDKQTGLALSGVTVSINGNSLNEKSITDVNGQAQKMVSIAPGTYQIIGEKNGIKTPLLTLTDEDFKTSSSVIFKEIYHDDPRFTLVGETFDCVKGVNLASINTVLTNTSSKNNISQTSDVQGKFIYQLDAQSDFTVVANQQGRYSQTELVSTKGLDRSKTLYVTLKLGVCELSNGSKWVLKNILYDFDKSDIRSDAAIILDNVVTIMKQNPSLKIELSSHTDSRGNDKYNLQLSQRRAEAAVNYLVANGIERNRLIAKGYGETKLLNRCANGVNCSEEEHQANRRTEIKVLNY
ncbi:OmpA family protein [Pedobacter montanisoli]|uniref:OmpA family protein n=1 Tax=Pedobacter montanisoli TaxID=2923277 RepID=A0ABS9ZXL6_9SPHI|nr:OmpA family protein [Pedobacter montanisoli]MCJ0743053.1 OmpA family protein [Pedobacter montanisoli]